MTSPDSKPLLKGHFEINESIQWIEGYGDAMELPALLVLHGGPGLSHSGMSRKFQSELEKHFIVVNWDQRSAGKSYSGKNNLESLTIHKFVEDARAVVTLLKDRLNKQKIFLMGISWGSLLAMLLIDKFPDYFSGYIGVSQMTNVAEMEKAGFEWTLNQARLKKNSKAIRALSRLHPPHYESVSELITVRTWQTHFGGNTYPERSLLRIIKDYILLAPRYTLLEKWNAIRSAQSSLRKLYKEILATDLTFIHALPLPVLFCMGRHDQITPLPVMEEFFKQLDAPRKNLVVFEESGHTVFNSENSKVQNTIIELFGVLKEVRT